MVEYRYYHIGEEFPILILQGEKWTQNYGDDVDSLHFHNHLEIGYCYEGSGRLVLGDQTFRYQGGMFSFISKNQHHTTYSDPGGMCTWSYLFIDLDNLLKRTFKDHYFVIEKIKRNVERKAYLLKEADNPVIGSFIRNIFQISMERGDMYQQELENLCVCLLLEFSRLEVESVVMDKILKENVLVPALEYINVYYAENIRVDQLAELCHMSETHLRRCFQNIVHMSPVEYLNRKRVDVACEKLRSGKTSVNMIAEQCGFATSSTFNRNFRKVTGYAPVEWRKRQNEYEHIIRENEIKTEEGW